MRPWLAPTFQCHELGPCHARACTCGRPTGTNVAHIRAMERSACPCRARSRRIERSSRGNEGTTTVCRRRFHRCHARAEAKGRSASPSEARPSSNERHASGPARPAGPCPRRFPIRLALSSSRLPHDSRSKARSSACRRRIERGHVRVHRCRRRGRARERPPHGPEPPKPRGEARSEGDQPRAGGREPRTEGSEPRAEGPEPRADDLIPGSAISPSPFLVGRRSEASGIASTLLSVRSSPQCDASRLPVRRSRLSRLARDAPCVDAADRVTVLVLCPCLAPPRALLNRRGAWLRRGFAQDARSSHLAVRTHRRAKRSLAE